MCFSQKDQISGQNDSSGHPRNRGVFKLRSSCCKKGLFLVKYGSDVLNKTEKWSYIKVMLFLKITQFMVWAIFKRSRVKLLWARGSRKASLYCGNTQWAETNGYWQHRIPLCKYFWRVCRMHYWLLLAWTLTSFLYETKKNFLMSHWRLLSFCSRSRSLNKWL